jgi:hypothetical protein
MKKIEKIISSYSEIDEKYEVNVSFRVDDLNELKSLFDINYINKS